MESLEQAVFRALSVSVASEAGMDEAPVLIRRAFVNPSPPPPPENQDVLYYHLIPEAGSSLTEETILPDSRLSFFRFSPYRLNLVFYGPRAEALAWRVFHRLFRDGFGQPRRILREAGIYPIPDRSGPLSIWEEWEKHHRPRADLVFRLRIACNEISSPAAVIDSPPDPLLHWDSD